MKSSGSITFAEVPAVLAYIHPPPPLSKDTGTVTIIPILGERNTLQRLQIFFLASPGRWVFIRVAHKRSTRLVIFFHFSLSLVQLSFRLGLEILVNLILILYPMFLKGISIIGGRRISRKFDNYLRPFFSVSRIVRVRLLFGGIVCCVGFF